MNFDSLVTITSRDPDYAPAFSKLFAPSNITAISKEITKRLKERTQKNIRVPDYNIIDNLKELYLNRPNSAEVLTNEVINYCVESIIQEDEIAEQNFALDPNIMMYDDTFGISKFNQSDMKLNYKKYNNVNFDIKDSH